MLQSVLMATEAQAASDPVSRLAGDIAACHICVERAALRLPHAPRPILRISSTMRIVIASQAPGARAHASGVPFDDASGERLRQWLGTPPDVFYDAARIGIVPMGFCFPGYDAHGGDKPPRPECQAHWHDRLFTALPQVELIVCIGLHAARYHLDRLGLPQPGTLRMGDLAAGWRALFAARTAPRVFPLPHPSWRNTAWINRNPWFERDVLPALRREVARLVDNDGQNSRSGSVQPPKAAITAQTGRHVA